MKQHPYAVFGHKRESVGRIVGVISLLISPSIGSWLTSVTTLLTGNSLTVITITAGVVYFCLDWGFNNYIWKFKPLSSALGLPNFNGKWQVVGHTLNDDGTIKFEWAAVWEVEQSWREISAHLFTSKSSSYSYTASLLKLPKGIWQVSYSYSNEPNLIERGELQSHRGFCELTFTDDLKSATGAYFNSHGRRTFGNMQLTQIEN